MSPDPSVLRDAIAKALVVAGFCPEPEWDVIDAIEAAVAPSIADAEQRGAAARQAAIVKALRDYYIENTVCSDFKKAIGVIESLTFKDGE